jgi:hypothetical protein
LSQSQNFKFSPEAIYTFAINVFGGENVSMGKRGQHLRGRYFATNYIMEENRRKKMTEEEKRREDIITVVLVILFLLFLGCCIAL